MCGQVQLTYGTATHCPQGNDLHLRPTERGWTVLGLSSGAVPSGCAGWPLPARGPRSAPGSMARPPHPCFSACAPPPSWPPRSHGRGLGRFCSATEPRKGKGLAGGGVSQPVSSEAGGASGRAQPAESSWASLPSAVGTGQQTTELTPEREEAGQAGTGGVGTGGGGGGGQSGHRRQGRPGCSQGTWWRGISLHQH